MSFVRKSFIANASDADLCKLHRHYVTRCLMVALLVPIMTHVAFSSAAPCKFLEAQWTADGLLDYAGSIIGAAVAVLVVVLTIESERQGRVEEQRLASVPIISMVVLEKCFQPVDESDSVSDCPAEVVLGACKEGGYQEFEVREGYIVVGKDGLISYMDRLSEEQQSLAYSGPWRKETYGGLTCDVRNEVRYCPLRLYSSGNGSAVNVSVWLERNGESPSFKGAALHLPTMQMPVGTSGYVGVLFENVMSVESTGEYELVIRYSDVMGNTYQQRHVLRVRSSIQDGEPVKQVSLDLKIRRELVLQAD